MSQSAAEREGQCAYRRIGARIHHRVPACGMPWVKFTTAVWRGDIEVLSDEPSDSQRCRKCYSEESYRKHPL